MYRNVEMSRYGAGLLVAGCAVVSCGMMRFTRKRGDGRRDIPKNTHLMTLSIPMTQITTRITLKVLIT